MDKKQEARLRQVILSEIEQCDGSLCIKGQAMAASVNAMVIADLTAKITYVNAAFLSLLGHGQEQDILGHSALDLWHDREEAAAVLEDLLEKDCYLGNLVARRADGRLIDVHLSAAMVYARDGTPANMMFSFVDITHRQEAEKAKELREERLERQNEILLSLFTGGAWFAGDLKSAVRAITEACGELIQADRVSVWKYNQDRTVLSCYNLYEKDKGRHSQGEEVKISRYSDYARIHSSGKVIAVKDVFKDSRTRAIPASYYAGHDIKSLLDSPLWINNSIGGILSFEHTGEQRDWNREDEQLSVSMATLISLCFEAYERKKVEEALQASLDQALRESEYNLKKTQEMAQLGSWEYDLTSNQLFWSRETYRIFGLDPGGPPVTYQAFLQAVHPEDRDVVDRAFGESLEDNRDTYEIEHRIIRKDTGETRYVHERCEHYRDDSGKIARSVGMVQDVTEREERTAQLKAKNQELETFAYSVSHDLKAPLRGIDGYSRLLLEDYNHRLDEEGLTFIYNIRQSVDQMRRLIDDLLAYSRLEQRAWQSNTISLKRLVESVASEAAGNLGERGGTLSLEVPDLTISVDLDGIALALRNLIDNAVKFTAAGQAPEVTIGAYEKGDALVIWVRDKGIGFAMKYHDRIFGIFNRLHRSEDYAGTGIGLAMVRKAMERMGGRIWAESKTEQGSTFYLELPLGKNKQADKGAEKM